MHAVALFAEGDLEDVIPCTSGDTAAAFAAGAVQGSSYYGSGCGAYALPDELEEMTDCEEHAEVEKAIAKARGLGVVLPEVDR